MKIDYLGNVPLNLTLNSGNSFYAKPKQGGLEISEQDWMMTKRLSILKKKNLFRVVDDSEPSAEVQKKSFKAKEMAFDEPKPKFEEQPETFAFDANGRLTGTRPLDDEDRKKKIYRKKVKILENGK